jgi:hypothetical protein
MPALTGPALVAAALLAVAGALKLIDPIMTVGALRALRLPASPLGVRAGSAVELALGVAAVSVGGAALWWLVAASYLAFGAFVVAALGKGTMIGSCGCFGREDTPPHWFHLVANLGLAGLAAGVAVRSPEAPIDALIEHPVMGSVVVVLAGLTLALLYAIFVEASRTLDAARTVRGVGR